MEIQFAKKTNAVNFVKSCINFITLLSTSNITLMKPLRSKSLPICQIMLWTTLTKTFPKLTPVRTCWYVKDFLLIFFSLLFLYSNGHMHTFRVNLADNYCKGSWLILNGWRLPNLHTFFFRVCVDAMLYHWWKWKTRKHRSNKQDKDKQTHRQKADELMCVGKRWGFLLCINLQVSVQYQ